MEGTGRTVFTEEEMTLAQLINAQGVLENKKTDAASMQQKAAAWARVAAAYVSYGFPERTVKQLKKCWDNMKLKQRQRNTVAIQNRLVTGGGPAVEVAVDPVLDVVAAVAAHDIELDNPYDSTGMFGNENILVNEDVLRDIPIQGENVQSAGRSDVKQEKKRGRTPKTCTCLEEVVEAQKKLYAEKLEHQRRLQNKREETAQLEYEMAQTKMRAAQYEEELAKFNLEMAKKIINFR